jgi:phosphoserine phosphatase
MIVAFDLEGTLVDGELFPAIGEELGIGRQLEALTAQAMDGRIDYASSVIRRVEFITGTGINRIMEISRGLPIQRGAYITVDAVKSLGAQPVIVTGGFSQLADRVAYRLGIEHVACNNLIVENGLVTGVHTPILTGEGKRERLTALSRWLGVPLSRCAAIGDGSNDVPMLKAAGLSIGFGDRECVQGSDYVVRTGNLADAIPFLRAHLENQSLDLSHPTPKTVL